MIKRPLPLRPLAPEHKLPAIEALRRLSLRKKINKTNTNFGRSIKQPTNNQGY